MKNLVKIILYIFALFVISSTINASYGEGNGGNGGNSGNSGSGLSAPTCTTSVDLECNKYGDTYKYFRKSGVNYCIGGDLNKACTPESSDNSSDSNDSSNNTDTTTTTNSTKITCEVGTTSGNVNSRINTNTSGLCKEGKMVSNFNTNSLFTKEIYTWSCDGSKVGGDCSAVYTEKLADISDLEKEYDAYNKKRQRLMWLLARSGDNTLDKTIIYPSVLAKTGSTVLVNKDKVEEETKKISRKIAVIKEVNKNKLNAKVNKSPSMLPKTGTPINDRVETMEQDGVMTNLPNSDLFKLAGDTNTDLSHWLQVLPEQDRYANEYLIIPSNGLVIPVNRISENNEDYNLALSGREIEINKYLQNGAVIYPGAPETYGTAGNSVIFGHSSYWNDDGGRYKTHFQKIIELDNGESIIIYKKNTSGSYDRFKYVVNQSYNTDPSNTSVMEHSDRSEITLVTCTPIGGIKGRWIVKAEYIDEAGNIEREELRDDLYVPTLPLSIKRRIINFVNKFSDKFDTNEEKLVALSKVYNKIKKVEDKYTETKGLKLDIIRFLKSRILIKYNEVKTS